MATLSLPVSGGEILMIPLLVSQQVTVDIAGGAGPTWVAPFKGRVLGAVGICGLQGGTPHTDIDLTIQNANNSDANMLTGVIPVVNASVIVRDTNVVVGPSTVAGAAAFSVLDNIELVVDITGGTTPTAECVGAYLLVQREP